MEKHIKAGNLPTAHELLFKYKQTQSEISSFMSYSMGDCLQAMQDFAKLHVTAALKEAAEKADVYDGSLLLDPNSILNAYPLTNIK